jgi:hypothetical protein
VKRGQVGVLAGIGISLGRQRGQHAADVLEVFVRIPAATHSFDVELEGFIGETFVVKDAHRFLERCTGVRCVGVR